MMPIASSITGKSKKHVDDAHGEALEPAAKKAAATPIVPPTASATPTPACGSMREARMPKRMRERTSRPS